MTVKHVRISVLFLFITVFSGCYLPGPDGRVYTPAPGPEPGKSPSYEKKNTPPPWAPAHGRRAKHNYRYYPSSEIYFDTGRGLYFYMKNGSWTVSASLPGGVRITVRDFVNLEMDTDRPYDYHGDVVKKYPGDKKEKNKEKNKDKDKNKDKSRDKKNSKNKDKNSDEYDKGWD